MGTVISFAGGWFVGVVIGLIIQAGLKFFNLIQSEKKEKSLLARVEALEAKVKTLEMWSDYGISEED